MVREGKSCTHGSGELRTVAARSEKPDRRQRDVLRHRAHGTERMTLRKGIVFEQEKLLKPLQKVVFAETLLPPPQRIGRDRIRAGRAAEPEIDAAGKQRLEHLEAFSHHQRRMVRQHDAAGTYAYALGRRRDL